MLKNDEFVKDSNNKWEKVIVLDIKNQLLIKYQGKKKLLNNKCNCSNTKKSGWKCYMNRIKRKGYVIINIK